MTIMNSKRMAKLAGLLKEQAMDEWIDEGPNSWGKWVPKEGPLDDRADSDELGGVFEEEGAEEEDVSVYDALNADDVDEQDNERFETDNYDSELYEQVRNGERQRELKDEDGMGTCRSCGHPECEGWMRSGKCARCPECEIEGNAPKDLDESINEISSDAPSFKRFGGLDSHPDHSDTDIECSACGEVYDSNDTEYHKSHLRGHKAAAENKSFTGRMDEHYNPERRAWRGRSHNKGGKQVRDLRDSITDREDFGVECDVCNETFDNYDLLRNHNEEQHADPHPHDEIYEQLSPKEYLAGYDESPIDPPDWERDAWGKIIDPDFPDDADKEFRRGGWDEQETYHKATEEKEDEDLFRDDEDFGGSFGGKHRESPIKFESLKIIIRSIIKEVAVTKGKTKSK